MRTSSRAVGILLLGVAAATGCSENKGGTRQAAPEQVAAGPTVAPSASGSVGSAVSTGKSTVAVTVDGKGYTPRTIEAKAGQPLTLVFKRTSEKGCGDELVFPERGIRRQLPLNEEVVVTLTPDADERIVFTCGMGMYRGAVVATR